MRQSLFLAANRLLSTLPRARVRSCPLSPNRKAPLVTLSAIAIDGSKPLQRRLLFTSEIALNCDPLALNHLSDLHQLVLRQLTRPQIAVDSSLLQNLQRTGGSDSIYITERCFDPLLVGYFNSKNSCHVVKRRCGRVIGPDAKGASYLAELPMLASGNPQFYRVQDSQLGSPPPSWVPLSSACTSIKA